MTITDRPDVISSPAKASASPAAPLVGTAALAAVIVGMIVGSVYRQGAFFPRDAFGLAVVSLLVAVVAFMRNRDRNGAAVFVTLGGLAVWWLIRALVERTPVAFLPFGASLLGFLAAFMVMRNLEHRDRSRVAVAVVAIGTVTALTGIVGELLRWHLLAQQTDGVWRASTTLTYPDATAVLCIVALLLAMALDLQAPLPRVAVCLCLTGLIATQSHWDLLALACGALVIPRRRWSAARWPLAMGSLAGLAVVASDTGSRPGWASCGVVVVAVVSSTRTTRRSLSGAWLKWAAVGGVPIAMCAVLLMLHPLIGRGPVQPANQHQTVAWSAASESWGSSIVTGVGPPRTGTVHASVDASPGFAPDSYLTIAAQGGLVGGLLLLAAGAAVAVSLRRRDLASSCAVAATIAFAVAGGVDFSWQLPGLALLGGCVAGLAADSEPPDQLGELPRNRVGRRFRHLPGGVASAWVITVVLVVTAQLVAGISLHAGATTNDSTGAPSPTSTPLAPARFILSGPESNDPFMLKDHGLYYLYTSQGTSDMSVPLRVGSRPGHWGPPVDVLPRLPAWAEAYGTWAPDVHAVAGGWALYFTALLNGVNPLTHCIGSAFATSPTGPFVATDHPFICQLDHRGSIDARVFVDTGNRPVMLWKSEDNANPSVPGPDQNGPTGIYAEDLSADGRTLLGRPVKIFAPSQRWEGTIVEAPDMIQAWGTYWMVFSGNWYNSDSYGIGVAACQTVFGPCSDPYPEPFIGSNRQGAGPGESSLFRDGPNVYLLYGPFRANDPGPVIPRPVAMVRLGFKPTGPYVAAP